MIPVVLVAEDDPMTRRLIEVTVGNCGCDVVCVPDGQQALDKICELNPRIAILDVQMPRLSGLEVGKELTSRGKGEGTTIIFLSARAQENDVLEGFLSGASDYLFKPFSPRELQARIRSILARS